MVWVRSVLYSIYLPSYLVIGKSDQRSTIGSFSKPREASQLCQVKGNELLLVGLIGQVPQTGNYVPQDIRALGT